MNNNNKLKTIEEALSLFSNQLKGNAEPLIKSDVNDSDLSASFVKDCKRAIVKLTNNISNINSINKQLESLNVRKEAKSRYKTNILNRCGFIIDSNCELIDWTVALLEKSKTIDINNEEDINLIKSKKIELEVSNTKLEHKYYSLQFRLIDRSIEELNKKFNNYDERLLEADKIANKFESLGSTVLNMIISFSIVSTAITAIDKIKSIYLPLFIMSIVWLAMTVMVFNHSLFSKEDELSKNSVKMYKWISILTIFLIIYSVIWSIIIIYK